LQYQVGCRCGQQLVVTADEAGTTVRCECGADVPVPSLSKLRATAGIGSYETGTIDTIRRMLDQGTLPWGGDCAVSGRPTRDVLQVKVQCERLHVPKDHARYALLLAVCAGPLWALLAVGSRQRPTHGRDTVVVVPLRVCCEYHRGLSPWWMRRKLRRLLRGVPVYARLLDEYPGATISATGSSVESLDPMD
jgi:hypothetical protein